MELKDKKKRIAFATGSRADYGIVRNYLNKLKANADIELSILVTGALLSEEYGHQVDLIFQDGFSVGAQIEIPIDSSSNQGVLRAMSVALDKFGTFFSTNRFDLLIILGDRYEMLSVATAAAVNRIPILHIHGGEATYGNYDEFIRHAITKMSLFHFAATEEYRKRIIQLGETPDRVFNLGALGAENCLQIDETKIPTEVKDLTNKSYFVVLFHPETLTNICVDEQIEELLGAIDVFGKYRFVFIGSNADTNSNVIRKRVKEYVNSHANCMYFENLPTAGYHYLVKHSQALVGNSSSGLIEAPSLGTYTINIGDRQEGRTRGNSVFDVKCSKEEIISAVNHVLSIAGNHEIVNPYFQKCTAENYYSTTLKILKKLDEGVNEHPKRFYDL